MDEKEILERKFVYDIIKVLKIMKEEPYSFYGISIPSVAWSFVEDLFRRIEIKKFRYSSSRVMKRFEVVMPNESRLVIREESSWETFNRIAENSHFGL